MAHLIDKDALVAELKKRFDYRVNGLKAINNNTFWDEDQSEDEFNAVLTRCAYNAAKNEVFELMCFLDTLEVKEVDEEPVSEDLEEAGKEWLRPQLDKTYAKYGETKMMELTRFDGYAMLDAIEFGAQWKKEQMMANAVDAEVHIDAGGYPYIPEIELYDYDKDVPLAKEGDKYKVVLIKEE